jgi:DNA replication initiation complex subunit (GINS family)
MMKSAYELAMERLQKGSPTITLTAEQKAELAEIDSSFNAKIAERKIFLTDQITKAAAAGKFDDVESLEKQLTADVHRLQEDCEHKKEKLRASFGAR